MSPSRYLSALLAGFAVVALPAAAVSQVCTGVPSSGRDLTVAPIAQFTEGIDSYGAMLHFNSPGYLSYGAGGMLDSFENEEDDGHTLFGRITAELDPERRWPVEVCVVGTGQYSRLSTTFTLGDFVDERFIVIGGVGVGKSFPITPRASLGAFVVPGLYYVTAEREIAVREFVTVEEDSSSGFTTRVGGTLAFDRFFLEAEYRFIDITGVDDVVGVSLGYNIRIP